MFTNRNCGAVANGLLYVYLCCYVIRVVKMLFCLSIIESKGDVSKFLKTFLFTFLGLFSYSCLYFDIAFSIHSLVYFVVMSLASFLAVFAIVAISSIHMFSEVFVVGGSGICTFW